MKNIKKDFPIFTTNPDLIYLDSASTLQKPQSVIDAVSGYLSQDYANIHRGTYDVSLRSEELYREARKTVAGFIGVTDESEVIFTSDSTDSVNLLVWSFLRSNFFKPGDNIVLTELEHHANLVPRQMVAEMTGAELRWIPVGHDGSLDLALCKKSIDKSTKVIAVSACSNVTGRLWIDKIKELSAWNNAQSYTNPLLVVDASQAVVHTSVDVADVACDMMFFTGHKLGALTGVGVLRGKKEILKKLQPGKVGGGAVEQVTSTGASYVGAPDKFEPGTPNVAGAISLAEAIKYIQAMREGENGKLYHEVEEKIIKYCLEAFRVLEDAGKVTLLGGYEAEGKIGLFSFVPHDVDVQLIDAAMNEAGIALRSGAHCTHIYHAGLVAGPSCGVEKSCRISFWAYTELADVENFFEVLDSCLG